MQIRTFRLILPMVFLALLCGCGTHAELDNSIATLTVIRGNASNNGERSVATLRLGADAELSVSEESLARLELDGGAQLLLDATSSLRVQTDAIHLDAGRLFIQCEAGESLRIEGAERTLRIQDAAMSITVNDDRWQAYVVHGEVAWRQGDERGVTQAGETLALSNQGAQTNAEELWIDWTGGLALPGPSGSIAGAGLGTLQARIPDERGQARWSLVMRRLDVTVNIEEALAITEVEQVFFNPSSASVEGQYRIRIPEGAVLQRFAVDRNGRLVDGYVREEQQARAAYQAQVYRGSRLDPALLEWVAPGQYQARIYPIQAGAIRRIVIRYAEWLTPTSNTGVQVYRYPMASRNAPQIQDMSIAVNLDHGEDVSLRAGLGATLQEGRVRVRESDFTPRSDFWLEIRRPEPGLRAWLADHRPPLRAPGAPRPSDEADERPYWYLPLRLPTSLTAEVENNGMDMVIVADVSAATTPAELELGRSMIEALTGHLRPEDRLSIVTSDVRIRSLEDGETHLQAANPAHVESLLDGLARVSSGGATDLGAAITQAAELLDPERPGIVVYVGDGAPTVGELEAADLLDRIHALPRPVRLYAIATGSEANLDLLEALCRGGGQAIRVEERVGAAEASLQILGHATRPLAQRVTVDLGNGLENIYPRGAVDVVLGDALPIIGRLAETPPSEVTVRGMIHGIAFEERMSVTTQDTDESTDLRLRWANERLHQLLLEGATRAEIAELGTRYGLITPYTSFYVPSANELAQMGEHASLLRQPTLDEQFLHRTRAAQTLGDTALAILFTPLTLSGCNLATDDAPANAGEGVGSDDEYIEETWGPESPIAPPSPTTTAGAPNAAPPEQPAPPQAAADQALPPVQRARSVRQRGASSPSNVYERQLRQGVSVSAAEAEADAPSPNDEWLDWSNDDPATTPGSATGLAGLGLRSQGSGGGGSDPGYGRGAGEARRAEARRTESSVRVRQGVPEVRGGLARNTVQRVIRRHRNQIRLCYQQLLTTQRDAAGEIIVGFTIHPTGRITSPHITNASLENRRMHECMLNVTRRWRFPSPSGGGVVHITQPWIFSVVGGAQPPRVSRRHRQIDPNNHRVRHCSDASRQTLSDRRTLWRERLQGRSSANGWREIYRVALRQCEARNWRARRALLSEILRRARSVSPMIAVYRQFDSQSVRAFLHRAILRRVRSPEDLRQVRAAFGVDQTPDWTLVEQILERNPTPARQVRALRALVAQYPASLALKLRLLETLERSDRQDELRRYAAQLRQDPRSDAGVRTAIGELYLRLDMEDEARRVFSEIVEFAPLNELARRRLGDLYRAHAWYEDAYRQYQTLAEIRPDDPSVLLLLAQAAAGMGRIDEALRLEQRLMQTGQPGSQGGLSEIASLWSSIRFAKLRAEAQASTNEERTETLDRTRRRSGVLRRAGDLRVALIWSHPDAGVGLWAGFPNMPLSRPTMLAPEYGIEVFEVAEQESGSYRFEVRRPESDHPGNVEAELVVLLHEGADEEAISIVPVTLSDETPRMAWTLTGDALRQTTPSMN